jgi:hypothetical protein
MKKANYIFIRRDKDKLVIRDVGPWETFMTVSNAAEEVVEELVRSGQLSEGFRLFYYDSEGVLDEILVKDGKFAGFAFVSQVKS